GTHGQTTLTRTASALRVGGRWRGAVRVGVGVGSGSGGRVTGATGVGLGRGSGSAASQCGETGPLARANPTTAMYATPASAAPLAIIHTRRRRRPVTSTKTERPATSVGSSSARAVDGPLARRAAQPRPPVTTWAST